MFENYPKSKKKKKETRLYVESERRYSRFQNGILTPSVLGQSSGSIQSVGTGQLGGGRSRCRSGIWILYKWLYRSRIGVLHFCFPLTKGVQHVPGLVMSRGCCNFVRWVVGRL